MDSIPPIFTPKLRSGIWIKSFYISKGIEYSYYKACIIRPGEKPGEKLSAFYGVFITI